MNSTPWIESPAFVVLFRWTCLLALGWVAHLALRRGHARWRLVLWRGILCLAPVLPLLQYMEFPGVKIPIHLEIDSGVEPTKPLPSVTLVDSNSAAVSATRSVNAPIEAAPGSGTVSSLPVQLPTQPVSWTAIIIGIWILGGVGGMLRLIRLNRQLSVLRQESSQATTDLQRLATEIQHELQVQQIVEIRISDKVTSPFVCGLLKPAVLLPRILTQQLSPGELHALLSHEMAHIRQRDLFWCVAWRWMKSICWFHPLVWNVPSAHNLACEQEADRLASRRSVEQNIYSRMLARLALRVLALPTVETELTLNGVSQIAQRLNHLGRTEANPWNWKHSIAGLGMIGALFLVTAGCQLSKSGNVSPNDSTKVEFKKVLVVVQDEKGKPIEGATILPDGFRVKGLHGADAYHWGPEQFGGPPEKAVTDRDGQAYVKYPVMGIPEEKELTGKLIFSVSHPEFSTVRPQEYSVDSPEPPIRMTRGIHLEVSGYAGSDHQPVTELIPNLNEEIIHPEDWQKKTNGVIAYQKLSPGGHLIQLMGRLSSGEIVYSDSFAFTAERGREYKFDLEMKPGIRLEGRLDEKVPRPIKNGRVLISVRPKQFPAWNNYADVDDLFKQYPNVHPWKSYRLIAADGTFVFESVPPGGLDVIVHGAGFVSQNGDDFSQRINGKLEKVPGFALPQAFPLVAPITKIEVATEPTATLELTARTKWGSPVEGATIYVNPNVVRMNGIFGYMRQSSEAPFRALPPLPDVPYSAKTDKNGVAVIRNIPATDRGIEVFHADYQVPLQPSGWRDRHIRTSFAPGTTNRFELTLQSKGKDYVGSN